MIPPVKDLNRPAMNLQSAGRRFRNLKKKKTNKVNKNKFKIKHKNKTRCKPRRKYNVNFFDAYDKFLHK
jgi:hypothetical protein